ncbi:TonB-dependent receptor [Robertkochia solimangrovi]|uniref:TonB-dependent receptor n=1 Tax=Robertkochia solimangrovi TaxID=2213046 RepID=UPI00117ECA2F|nr:TonB-dependent receptor [Robertkochia solimangrovi]TRZ45407.1 hypothetical protein DMZ48_06585 [Robertkochia solimangrovi]
MVQRFKALTLLFLVFLTGILHAQQSFTLSGKVWEAKSNESVIGANIIIKELQTGTSTNEYGFYSITLPKGTYTLIFSSLGYKNSVQTVDLNSNMKLNMPLEEDTEELEAVEISGTNTNLDIRSPQMSVNTMTVKSIKQIPVVLGEADVIKSLLLLPGVSSGGEASSGFNVRGGAADQNLILLDEANIFNSSHLFGLYSVFNPDAIKDVKLYKGGIPARYGGRVSSVLDIYQKEGNTREFHMNGGIGAVASRILMEGPIIKDRTSFLIGGRASYVHLLLPLFDVDNSANFYDLNAKISHRINENNNIYFSGYFGRDKFKVNESFVNTYGNAVLNFRWNHLFSDRLFSNFSLIYSDYDYGLKLDFVGFNWKSGIQNMNLKYDLKHYLTQNLQVNYGVNNIYYIFNPGKITPTGSGSGIIEDQLVKKYANELAVYIDIEHEVTKNLTLQYGLRYSHFTRLGQDEISVYEDNNPVFYNPLLQIYQQSLPIETRYPGRGKSLATYDNFEPRFSFSLLLNEFSSIKGSYTRLAQYLHLLSNTSSPTPLDVWTPSGPFIKPQLMDQFAFGYFREINNSPYTIESEVYYKKLKNRIDYIDGAQLIANEYIERSILNGRARAYGLEFMLKKNEGKFTGWLSYTLSKSEQQTPGRGTVTYNGYTAEETGINNGEWYNTPYDKTHDIAFFGNYQWNEKWTLNGNFIFQTGQPTNYPIGQFEFEGLVVPYYGIRNQERLPTYHRLDISVIYKPKHRPDKKWESEWVFSIYNVYNRRNAASINFRRSDEGNNEAVRIAIFGIVPSITYNFKF